MFSTYSQLLVDIGDWLNRKDAATVAAIPGFVQLAEADIRADMESRNVTTEDSLTLDGPEVTLPADVGTPLELFVTAPQWAAGPIQMVTRSTLVTLSRRVRSGAVRYGAVVDGTLYLVPAPSADDPVVATLIYQPQVAPLVNDADTNWVLQNHPNLYLYASLRHSAMYLRDDARKAAWDAAYVEHLSRMESERDRHELGTSPLNVVFPRGFGER